MRILGIDTATRTASVGVLIDGEVVAEQSEGTDGNHAASLLPLIDRVLRDAGCLPADVDTVAVSGGPGSFTGLRIGRSVAKGLAWAIGGRVVTVPTLEALARTVRHHQETVCALLDARKGELYAACFDARGDEWKCVMPDALLTPETLLEQVPTPCVILGDALVRYGSLLQSHFGSRATLLPFPAHAPRGGMIAAMAWERQRAGVPPADLSTIEPFYIRRSEAEMKYTG